MKRIFISLLLVTFILNSCSPVNPESLSKTSEPTATPTALPTPKPSIRIIEPGFLFAGPSNVDFDIITSIPIGATVFPLGKYRDFLKIEYEGQIGYTERNAFEEPPSNIGTLTEDSVPRINRNLINYFFDPRTSISDNVAIIDNTDSSDWAGFEIGPMAIPKPFSISMEMSLTGDFGGIVLSGRLNSSDQFWEDRLSIYVGASGFVDIRDGRSEESVRSVEIEGIKNQPFIIEFPDPNGKTLIFKTPDGTALNTIDMTALPNMNFPDGLFPEGVIYFGPISSPYSRLTVNQLEISIPPDGIFQRKSTTMRELADKKNIMLGVDLSELFSYNLKFREIVKDNFNGATISIGWDQIEPERGKYDFRWIDPQVEFALENNLKITGLHLLWGARESLPDWLVNGNYSKEELTTILHEYIIALCGHYKGKISIWSIANEYTSRLLYGGDFWYDNLGPEYVKLAFSWAHEIDPEAILILNQDGTESYQGENADIVSVMLKLAKKWKKEEIPIDAIGMQMHIAPMNLPAPQKEDTKLVMQQFSDLGFDIYITEFDFNLQGVSGSQEERFALQADGYRQMFEACMETASCKGFNIFGSIDPKSWLITRYPDADPLPFDKDYDPKPAYFELLRVLEE